MPLKAAEIRHFLSNDTLYRKTDEKGLYGSKRWYFKYRILGREKHLALGRGLKSV